MISNIKIGTSILELASTDSTNRYASELLEKEDLAEGTIVRADFQTGGKGYSGNQWQSEKGKNLLLSIILKPSFLSPNRQFFLNQIVSLAVRDTVVDLTRNNKVRVKWPNDVICGDAKIAGILIESAIQGNIIQH